MLHAQVLKNKTLNVLAVMVAVSFLLAAPAPLASADDPKAVALLGVMLINDNEGLEPTSDAERARIASIEKQFRSMLEESGKYKFVEMAPEVKAKIDGGSPIGTCGGCEVGYGKELKADTVAWVQVQKVSNLILNMNVYMGDVASNKMTFVHSVDIRGNSDESWTRSMKYLVKNYLLADNGGGQANPTASAPK